jgi:hypothetical protein
MFYSYDRFQKFSPEITFADRITSYAIEKQAHTLDLNIIVQY